MNAPAVLIALAMCVTSCSARLPLPRSASHAPAEDVLLDIRRSEDWAGAAQHVTLTFRPGDSSAWLHVSSRRDIFHAFRTRSFAVPIAALSGLLDDARRDGLLQLGSTHRSCFDCTHFSGVVSFDGRVTRFWSSDEAMPPATVSTLWALAHLPEP